MALPELYSALSRCNRTELIQLCEKAGVGIHPNMPTEDILLTFLGDKPEVENPMNIWRDAIMGFILANWERIRPQLRCPASSQDPKACYECSDMRVVACLTTSSSRYQGEIQNAYDSRKRSA